MRFSAILFTLFLTLFSVQAYATSGVNEPAKPEPLQSLEQNGAAIRYLGKDGGLDGWVAIKDGQEQYFYVTPDGQGIVLGVLFNNKGDVVTMRQVEALRKAEPTLDKIANASNTTAPVVPPAAPETKAPATSSASKAEQLFQSVEGADWIAVGQKTAPAFYSFIDPQCPHCHDMVQDVRKSGALEKGQIQLRLIPVGLMNEESLKQAANLIAAENAPALLFKHLDGDKKALLSEANPNTQSVQRNMALMQAWKLDVTPFSVYKNKAGEVKILRGRPKDLNALIADLK